MTTRRQLIQGLAAGGFVFSVPLASCRQAAGNNQVDTSQAANTLVENGLTRRITLSGQLLMTHPLCVQPYPGFAAVVAELKRGQVLSSDLEIAIQTPASGAPTREGQFMHLAQPGVLDCIADMGFNLLSLANNHAWDLGTAGVLATRVAVADKGLGYAGTGPDLAAASAAGESPDFPDVALIGMAVGKIRDGAAATATRAGVNELRMPEPGILHPDDVQRNLASIRQAKNSGKTVLVCLHNHEWGENMALLYDWARQFAHDCVDAGADLFFSHGAPLLKGVEIYRGKPLLHGLGSLVFHSRTAIGHYPPEVWETAIVHTVFSKHELVSLEIVPVILNEQGDDPEQHLQTRGRPRLAEGVDAERILTRLQKLSEPLALGTRLEIHNHKARL